MGSDILRVGVGFGRDMVRRRRAKARWKPNEQYVGGGWGLGDD